MASVQYPVVNGTGGTTYPYSYDTMSRLTGVTTWATGAQYNAADQLTAVTYGSTSETRQYNALNQLTLISSASFAQQYVYSATQNNGQIIKQEGGPAGETVDYQYDVLNRLTSAVAEDGTWGQSYVYDGFGNLTQQNVTAGSAPSMSLTVNPANNRVTSFGGYDANGNQTVALNGLPIGYDVENRIVSQNNSRYFYNGSNQRVWKITGTTEEFAFYGLQGERLVSFNPNITTDSQGPHMSLTLAEMDGYFGSKLVYRKLGTGQAGTVLQDRLGSVRMDAGLFPNPQWTAYYPYGQERGSGTANDRMKFGTYRRDADTGLDYAMNRYYLSNWGRFMSPDPYTNSAELENPQSWNHYGYASNDPINRRDPSGLDDQDAEGNPPACYIGGLAVYNPFLCDPNPNQDCAPGNPIFCTTPPDQNPGPQPQSISTGSLPITFYLNVLAGFQEAMKRLAQPDCAKMFNPDGSYQDPFTTLMNTNYHVLSIQNQSTGAQTFNSTTVFINSQSAFFSQNLYNPKTGRFDYADFGTGLSGTDWMALLILHELGHQTGVFGDDSGPNSNPNQNRTNTQAVLDHCFTALGGGLYK